MTYWTILLITFVGGPLDGVTSFLLYPSYEECFAAHQIVGDTLPYDHTLECEETSTPSASVLRPQARPW